MAVRSHKDCKEEGVVYFVESKRGKQDEESCESCANCQYGGLYLFSGVYAPDICTKDDEPKLLPAASGCICKDYKRRRSRRKKNSEEK